MAARESAGLLMYRRLPTGELQVFLVHPGGPFFQTKDEGFWGIPKGEIKGRGEGGPTGRRPARVRGGGRLEPTREPLLELGWVRQKSGKVVHAWAFEDRSGEEIVCRSNTFP